MSFGWYFMDLQRFPHALLDDRFNRGMKHFCPKRFQSQLAQLEKCMSDVLSQNYQSEPNLKPEKQINHRFIYIQKKWLSLQKSKCDFNVKRKKRRKKTSIPHPHPNPKNVTFSHLLFALMEQLRSRNALHLQGNPVSGFKGQISEISVGSWEGGNPPKWLNNFEDLG